MTSDRACRRRLSDQDVRREFIRCSGSKFDPEIAKAFIGLSGRGSIRPVTIQGMAAKRDGRLLKSLPLEKRLLERSESDVPIKHTEDIRMLCFPTELKEKRNRSAAVFPLMFPEEQQRAVLDESKSGLSILDRFLTSAEKSQFLCYLREPESVSAFDTFLPRRA